MSSLSVFGKRACARFRGAALALAGVALALAGGGQSVRAGAGGTSGLLFSTFLPSTATSMAVDAAGNIYVAGTGAPSFVLKTDPTGSRVLYKVALPNPLGYPSIAVDPQGNVYLTGEEYSGSSGVTRTIGSPTATTWAPVIKIDPSGAILYHVRVGGSALTYGASIAVDGLGNAYVTGRTTSSDFPVTSGAFDTTFGGGDNPTYPYDAFVYKLSSDATRLVYGTYIGGSAQEEAHGIAVDGSGNAYVAGYTNSADFPVTSGAFQTSRRGVYDLFVTKLNAQGSALAYSTFLGGNGRNFATDRAAIAIDGAGDAFVVGSSNAPDYPTTSNATQKAQSGGDFNYVITALNNTGNALLFSTYLGGSAQNTATGIALGGSSPHVYVSGYTSATDFPTTANAFQATRVGQYSAGTVSVLDPQSGALVYSTYMGASDPTYWTQAMAVASDAGGDVYLGGSTPPEYPTTPGSLQPTASSSAGFLTRLVPATDLAFGRPATSSSNESSSLGPGNAVDGSYATRWSSQFSDPQWLAIDLGASFDISRVVLHWETAFAAAYQIQVSTDGTSWTTAASVSGGDGGVDDVAITGTGRYLRVYGTQRATGWGYSLWEVEAYGTPAGGGNAPPTVSLTSPANGTTIIAPATVTVSANAADSDGSIVRVDLYQDSTRIASLTAPPYTTTVSALAVGTYTFSAVATDNVGATTTSATSTVTVAPGSGGTLPAPWRDTDLATAYRQTPGTASYSNGSFTIEGGGYGIGDGIPDYGHYVYQPAGDAELVARVTTLQSTYGAAGAGVMWRDTVDPLSAEVSLIARPNGTIDMLARATSGSTYTEAIATVPATLPVWLKIVRTDPWFAAYTSTDGTNWTFVGSIRVAMTTGPVAGIVDVSGSGTAMNTATFDNVAVGGGLSGGLPSPWTSNDIGPVGVAGSASSANGVFTVAGAGADIWGTSDSFQYVSEAVNGDLTIVSRVTAEQNTSAFAKAGVMMRETLAANSAHVLLDVKPDGGVELMTRAATGASTAFLAGSSSAFPVWLKLARSGSTITASTSPDGTTWTVIGSASTSMAASIQAGLAVTSHDTTVANTATFDNVSVSAASGGLPAPWGAGDVGAVGVAGSSSYAGGKFTVKGSGADIWGTADAFQYVSQSIGNGQIVARVTAEQNTSAYAKAGVMLRETMAAGSANVVLDVKPDGGIELMTRSTAGGSTSFVAGGAAALPVWLKLVRSGSTVTGYMSTDGSTWSLVGSSTTSMAATANIGLAVTSHDNTVLNTATFDNVAVTPQ